MSHELEQHVLQAFARTFLFVLRENNLRLTSKVRLNPNWNAEKKMLILDLTNENGQSTAIFFGWVGAEEVNCEASAFYQGAVASVIWSAGAVAQQLLLGRNQYDMAISNLNKPETKALYRLELLTTE